MADIKTLYKDFAGDWQILAGPGFEEDDGLETAVIISLFTDRRAEIDDQISGDNRRGWWGDLLTEVEGDRIGSRLWLLAREKQLPNVLSKAREYAEEALQWLIEDGIASAVGVEAEIIRTGVLGLAIEIVRTGAPPVKYRFEAFWKGN